MRLELTPPSNISLAGVSYALVAHGDGDYVHAGDYVRIPGRTDTFYLYEPTSEVLPERHIVLFTPSTLAAAQRDPEAVPVARKQRPWQFGDSILSIAAISTLEMPPPDCVAEWRVRRVLAYDKVTEGDALRFFNYVARSDLEVPDEFWPVFLLWLRDEVNHHEGFKAVFHHLFGIDADEEERLAAESSDFGQFDSIMADPFKLLVALTYDEAATINGYQNDMYIYSAIGGPMSAFIHRVTSDEGWHFAKFAAMAATHYPHRLTEIDIILDDVFRSDGREYKRTFFLDHDPSVEPQFDETLRRRAQILAKRVILSKGRLDGIINFPGIY